MTTPTLPLFEVTQWTKAGGPLTKSIALGGDGKTYSDGSACVMCNGAAVRAVVHLRGFADLIESCSSAQAISLGSLRSDLPDQRLRVVTQVRWNKFSKDTPGADGGTVICRTREFVVFPRSPGVSLLDYDTKGMPKTVEERIEALGGIWAAMCSVLPELAVTAHVTRPSTSTGLYNAETGEKYPGSRGQHIYPLPASLGDSEAWAAIAVAAGGYGVRARGLCAFRDAVWLARKTAERLARAARAAGKVAAREKSLAAVRRRAERHRELEEKKRRALSAAAAAANAADVLDAFPG